MREAVLRDFFLNKVSVESLAKDVAGSFRKKSAKEFEVVIADMEGDFPVTSAHLLKLCDAVLTGKLSPHALHTIGFALIASDTFSWDADEDEVLANVILDWSCPEVNYPLTLENIKRFQQWLKRDEHYPPKTGKVPISGNVISLTTKRKKQTLKGFLRALRASVVK